jgi:hypothetical protein
MIIEQDTKVNGRDFYTKQTGDYEPHELVMCYLGSDPTKTEIVQFQANYIVNGENI